MDEKEMYGYEQLHSIPQPMWPWEMGLQPPQPSQFGQYVLVGCEQAGIEQAHQVEVIDESGFPLRSVWVIFGFGSGRDISLHPSRNYWANAPTVLKGNPQKTPISGYAQHTFQQGGESIWVWDIDDEGELKLPSPIITGCNWKRTPVGMFEHTGVKLTFQRRRTDVVPLWQRLANLEAQLAGGAPLADSGPSANVDDLRRRIETLEQIIG